MLSKRGLPWEQASMTVLIVPTDSGGGDRVKLGYACKTCGRFYGVNDKSSDNAARYCCAVDRPCQTKGCASRVSRGHTYCEPCRTARETARWYARPEKDWDGEAALCLYDGDKYFFDANDVLDYLEDGDEEIDRKLEDLRLEICRRTKPKAFCLADHYDDDMPEGVDFNTDEIDKVVNEYLNKRFPEVWEPTVYRASLASLKKYLGIKGGSDGQSI